MLSSSLPGYGGHLLIIEEECVQTWSLCRFKGQVMMLLQFCTATGLLHGNFFCFWNWLINYYFFFEEITFVVCKISCSASFTLQPSCTKWLLFACWTDVPLGVKQTNRTSSSITSPSLLTFSTMPAGFAGCLLFQQLEFLPLLQTPLL